MGRVRAKIAFSNVFSRPPDAVAIIQAQASNRSRFRNKTAATMTPIAGQQPFSFQEQDRRDDDANREQEIAIAEVRDPCHRSQHIHGKVPRQRFAQRHIEVREVFIQADFAREFEERHEREGRDRKADNSMNAEVATRRERVRE
jgi:hypothetical protein